MTDDSTSPPHGSPPSIPKAIWKADDSPSWWRDRLDAIEADFAASLIGRKESMRRLLQAFDIVKGNMTQLEVAQDLAISEVLKDYFDNAISEIFERAEKLALPLAAEIARRDKDKPSPERGR